MAEHTSGGTVVSTERPGDGYQCRGSRLFDEWVRRHPEGISEALLQVAALCGVSRTCAHKWRAAPAPSLHRQTLLNECGIALSEWRTWEPLPGYEPEEAPAKSEPRPVARAGQSFVLAPPRELGSLDEEIQRLLKLANQTLEGAVAAGGVSPTQLPKLVAPILAALKTLAQLDARRAIHEHADFPGLAEDFVDAVREALGPSAPPGIEARIAELFEQKQLERADAKHRKAAA